MISFDGLSGVAIGFLEAPTGRRVLLYRFPYLRIVAVSILRSLSVEEAF
jgi:hypothetical protein